MMILLVKYDLCGGLLLFTPKGRTEDDMQAKGGRECLCLCLGRSVCVHVCDVCMCQTRALEEMAPGRMISESEVQYLAWGCQQS